MNTLIDDNLLKVSVAEKASTSAVLCFTGVGHAMGGLDVQSEEFFNVSKNATAIFITDKERSWGNNIDFNKLKSVLLPYTENKTLFAIGNSMGGFLAIIASKFFRFKAAIAFVPQYSVSKNVVPDEERWPKYVSNIKNWQFESLEGSFRSNTFYYIISGYSVEEKRQFDLFPNYKNITKIMIKSAGFEHNVARPLKEMEALYPVIAACFNCEASPSIQRIMESSSNQGIIFQSQTPSELSDHILSFLLDETQK